MLDKHIQSRLFLQYPMLQQLPATDQSELLAAASVIHLDTGTVVFDENQVVRLPDAAVRYDSGHQGFAKWARIAALPRHTGKSCILTSSCLLGNTCYHARGVAEQALEIVLLPASVFHTLIAKQEAFRLYVFNLFSERLTDLMQLVSAVAFQKLDQRLANLLFSRPSPILATHQALADELGSVREIVSRLLKGFAEQGWIKLGREQIDIIDATTLKKFADL